MASTQNPMHAVRLEKVTLNIGVGAGGDKLENAKTLLERISSGKPATTLSKDRNPTWGLRKGDPIGCKVTMRGTNAAAVLKKALDAIDFTLKTTQFDNAGNVNFGIKEYIDFPGLKYDPKIGMLGFDVCVTLTRAGKRVTRRRSHPGKLGKTFAVTPKEAQDFMAKNFAVKYPSDKEDDE
jgi:large subunit ribosomal protein L5